MTANSGPLTDAEMAAAATVGKAMLAGMRRTKLPPRAQIAAAIHALAVVGPMILSPAFHSTEVPDA